MMITIRGHGWSGLGRLVALALALLSTLPFVDRDGRYILEPDFPFSSIRLYYKTIGDWSWAALPVPVPSPYFEGHTLIYAMAMRVLEAVPGTGTPGTFAESAWAAVSVVNALTHGLAVLVVYMTSRRLAGHGAVALVIAALFAFSPQLLDINLERVDQLMILPLVVILHVSVLIAGGQARAAEGAVLGVALALVAATKISGFLFAAFPVIAVLALLIRRGREPDLVRRLAVVVAGALVAGLPLLAVLMVRYVLNIGVFPTVFAASYAVQMSWTAVLPTTPLLYYNIDLFLGHGVPFLLLVGASVMALAVVAVRERDPTAAFLVASLLLFSVLGAITFKYSRGGYHLVPLYLYALAAASAWLRRVWRSGLAASLILLALPLLAVLTAYAQTAGAALGRKEAIAITRDEPRRWIMERFGKGARLCMMGSSQWAGPVLAGLDLSVVTTPFDFPYLDPPAMAGFGPPRLDQLRLSCDGVVFNNLHKELYPGFFRLQGHFEMGARWEAFYEALEKAAPPHVFEAPVPAYYVRRVEVYDLRDADRTLPGPGAAGRFIGSVDLARRFPDGSVHVQGWAADLGRDQPAAGVALTVDSRVVWVEGTATQRRPDVAKHFGKPVYETVGFSACLPPGKVPGDARTIGMFALGSDGEAGEPAAAPSPIRPADGVAKPEVCLPPGSEYER